MTVPVVVEMPGYLWELFRDLFKGYDELALRLTDTGVDCLIIAPSKTHGFRLVVPKDVFVRYDVKEPCDIIADIRLLNRLFRPKKTDVVKVVQTEGKINFICGRMAVQIPALSESSIMFLSDKEIKMPEKPVKAKVAVEPLAALCEGVKKFTENLNFRWEPERKELIISLVSDVASKALVLTYGDGLYGLQAPDETVAASYQPDLLAEMVRFAKKRTTVARLIFGTNWPMFFEPQLPSPVRVRFMMAPVTEV